MGHIIADAFRPRLLQSNKMCTDFSTSATVLVLHKYACPGAQDKVSAANSMSLLYNQLVTEPVNASQHAAVERGQT